MAENLTYDGRFFGNILVFGNKTSFVQNLGKNKIFGDIKTLDWISKVELSKDREEHIRKTFSYFSVDFYYLDDIYEFEIVLEILIDNKEINIKFHFEISENDKLDRLIVMDDGSGLAGKSTEFSSFLTVSRKYGYSYVYIVPIVFSHMSNWQMILSQTKIFNIFPLAIQLGNMSKILTNNCDRQTMKYIPKRELWINRLYFEIANRKNYSRLTIDCGKSVPAKYRTDADSNLKRKRKKIGLLINSSLKLK